MQDANGLACVYVIISMHNWLAALLIIMQYIKKLLCI